jgi:hypothetical protein
MWYVFVFLLYFGTVPKMRKRKTYHIVGTVLKYNRKTKTYHIVRTVPKYN